MMFPIENLILLAEKDKKVEAFLIQLYPKWKLWYNWFFSSQENPSLPFTFSWKGRTATENMPSGLDDYPRGYIVNEGQEIHLDLQSWMVKFSKFMAKYALVANDEEAAVNFKYRAERITQELNEKLYNKNIGLFSDYIGF